MIVVHNWFMNFCNLVKTVVHYLIIEGMTCLSCRDKFPLVSALMCMIIHWTRSIVNHNVSLSDCHDSSSYYIAWTLNLKRILSLY